MLDADLARLYGVTTKRFNEAFKRNSRRFPDDFAFQLNAAEFAGWRSQFAAPCAQPSDSRTDILNWSQFATSSSRRRGTLYRPWAFSEHGALMAANILRSEQAVQMSVFVIRAFVRTREQIAANAATGHNSQGVSVTPDGKYVVVQNYVEKELAFYRVGSSGLEDTGLRVPVSGHPAGLRIAPR